MSKLLYCRRCDLVFCEKHKHHHPDYCNKEPEDPPAETVGCCVCLGIFSPAFGD